MSGESEQVQVEGMELNQPTSFICESNSGELGMKSVPENTRFYRPIREIALPEPRSSSNRALTVTSVRMTPQLRKIETKTVLDPWMKYIFFKVEYDPQPVRKDVFVAVFPWSNVCFHQIFRLG